MSKNYVKYVLVVDILSYLIYYTYSGFKSGIYRIKYYQCETANDCMIAVYFTAENTKMKLGMLSFNRLAKNLI